MRPVLIFIALSTSAAVACLSASAASSAVKISSLPVSVVQGGIQHVNATVTKSHSCSLSVRYADGTSQALGVKRVISGRVGWTWSVSPTAVPGAAAVVIACGKGGTARGSFAVQHRVAPAQVVALKTGVTQIPDSFDSGTSIAIGIVLQNTSPDSDAIDVEVDVNLLDASSRVVGSETEYISGIPAGGTFYVADETVTHDSTRVVAVQPTIKIGESKPKAISVPVVSGVRVVPETYGGGAYIDGEVTNPASQTLDQLAEIYAVFFDAAGNVIGGGFSFPPFDVPPGGSAAFEIITDVSAASIASVQVSVEPSYRTS